MKSYTDLEQSKKLAEILPLESADMWWAWYSSPLSNGHYGDFPMFCKPVCNTDESVPCWSLATLIDVLPQKLIYDATEYTLEIYKNPDKSYEVGYFYKVWSYIASNNEELVDACVEIIEKLNELNLL